MSVEIDITDTVIKLTVPVEVTGIETAGQITTKVIPRTFIVEQGIPVDPAVYGIAHSNPGDFSDIIGQLRALAAELGNGERKFAIHVANSLNVAIEAIRNSTEL